MPEVDSLFRSIASSLAEAWAGQSGPTASDAGSGPRPGDKRVAACPVLPLQGVTLLVVEDSRFACEALRLMAQRSGARMRRAATLRDARRHLDVYRPDAVLVDMGLPDGSGSGLIRDLVVSQSPLVVLGMSGDPGQRSVALAAGAFGFIEKPLSGLAAFQSVLLRHLPGHGAAVSSADAVPEPDMLALTDDLLSVARMLDASPDAAQRSYIAGFLGGVARSAHDAPLEAAARSLHGADGDAVMALSGMVARRLGGARGAFDQTAHPNGD